MQEGPAPPSPDDNLVARVYLFTALEGTDVTVRNTNVSITQAVTHRFAARCFAIRPLDGAVLNRTPTTSTGTSDTAIAIGNHTHAVAGAVTGDGRGVVVMAHHCVFTLIFTSLNAEFTDVEETTSDHRGTMAAGYATDTLTMEMIDEVGFGRGHQGTTVVAMFSMA